VRKPAVARTSAAEPPAVRLLASAPAVRRRTLLLAVVAVLAPLAALLFAEARVGRALERRVYDGWFTLRGPLPRPREVVLVAIDLDSEASLGRYPWSRAWHARLLRNLKRAGARVVAFDLTFADTTAQDTAFAAAVRETGIAVLGAKTDVVFRRGARGYRLEEPADAFRGAPVGIVDERPDPVDGVVREYPVQECGEALASMTEAVAASGVLGYAAIDGWHNALKMLGTVPFQLATGAKL